MDQTLRGEETQKFVDGKYDNTMEPTLEEKLLMDDGHAVNGNNHINGKGGRHSADAESRRSGHGRSTASADHHRLLGSLSASSLGPERETEMLHRQRGRHFSESSNGIDSADDLRRRISSRMSNSLWNLPAATTEIDPFNFADPIDDSFYIDYWLTCAVHNTQIFRKVFKCVPDDTVTTWAEYKAFGAWSDRLAKSGKFGAKESKGERDAQAHSVPGASVGGPAGSVPSGGGNKGESKTDADEHADEKEMPSTLKDASSSHKEKDGGKKEEKPVEGFSTRELDQMEALLEELKGNLVLHPTRFLEAEDHSNNFLFAMDRINPLLIYD